MIRFFSSGDPSDPKRNASEATQIQSDLELCLVIEMGEKRKGLEDI